MSVGGPGREAASAQVGCWRASGRRHVLLEDSELLEAVPVLARDGAVAECLAEIVSLAPGMWPASEHRPQLCEEGLGLLILDGLVICRRGIDDRFGAELLGAGDLLRPCQETEDAPTLPLSTSRRVLAPARVAVLDPAFAESIARYPQLGEQLLARAINRSRNLAVLMAIVHQPRIDTRLHTLFRHLAARWGRMRADGVLVPLPLTHAVLADLVAARRPTVTSALAELSRRGLLRTTAQGWHLSREPLCESCELAGKPLAATIAA